MLITAHSPTKVNLKNGTLIHPIGWPLSSPHLAIASDERRPGPPEFIAPWAEAGAVERLPPGADPRRGCYQTHHASHVQTSTSTDAVSNQQIGLQDPNPAIAARAIAPPRRAAERGANCKRASKLIVRFYNAGHAERFRS